MSAPFGNNSHGFPELGPNVDLTRELRPGVTDGLGDEERARLVVTSVRQWHCGVSWNGFDSEH
jgi:hypothetical protein